jgi:hypothetical protein
MTGASMSPSRRRSARSPTKRNKHRPNLGLGGVVCWDDVLEQFAYVAAHLTLWQALGLAAAVATFVVALMP